MNRLFQRATGNLGKEDTKTVQIKYNRINEEEVRQYRHDTNRDKLNKQLKKDACRAVLDYLKFHNEKVSPPLPLPSLNEKKLTRSVFTANLELLDKLAYASLKSYSYTLNGSDPQIKTPPTDITKLSSLVGGKWSKSQKIIIGSWDVKNSEIGDDAVTVTFEFDFSNVHENDDLLTWQEAKTNPSLTTSSAMSNPSPTTSPTTSSRAVPYSPTQQELYYGNGWGLEGGKSTRRHRSNTHRRIKQKKRKTKKNNSRRRKNTRK